MALVDVGIVCILMFEKTMTSSTKKKNHTHTHTDGTAACTLEGSQYFKVDQPVYEHRFDVLGSDSLIPLRSGGKKKKSTLSSHFFEISETFILPRDSTFRAWQNVGGCH